MSFWIHAFCRKSVGWITAEDLIQGIAERLKLITYQFCPEEEEDPDAVLKRLSIEHVSGNGGFRELHLRYRDFPSTTFIPIVRRDRAAVSEQEAELALLSIQAEPRLSIVRQRLSQVTEDVSFCLKSQDVRGMGFPLSIAAAAYLVEQSDGLIQSGTYSWMIPNGREVEILLELER